MSLLTIVEAHALSEEVLYFFSMEQKVGQVAQIGLTRVKSHYNLHIQVANKMTQKPKDAAELAYRLRRAPRPDLVVLMILFIAGGMAILRREGLPRIGYR